MVKPKVSGIYLLPNLLTTSSLFAAFYAMIFSFKGMFESAAIAIFIGMIADSLDGRIARMTGTQTAFGAEYDSLSDMVTFGVAPALLMYAWCFQAFQYGWLVSFIYAATVALRLARFNIQLETADKRYFQGLACPAGAAVVTSLIWLTEVYHLKSHGLAFFLMGLSLIISLLMVSNIRYHSFKELDLKGKHRFVHLALIVLLFAAFSVNPACILWLASLGYALTGPVQTLVALHRMRRHRRLRRDRNKVS